MFHVHICLGKCHLGDDTFILIIQKVKRSEKTRRWLAQLTASSFSEGIIFVLVQPRSLWTL